MGNRGILHDDAQQVGFRRWRHRNWIVCLTEFKGRRRRIMAPNRYTELFFLDEVTALSAGHRPCAECRRDAYRAFREALETDSGFAASRPAAELDVKLHAERAWPRKYRQRTWTAQIDALPNGTMIDHSGNCLLVAGRWLMEWSFQEYRIAGEKGRLGSDTVTVLTPKTSVSALAGGYQPCVHVSAVNALAAIPGENPVFSKVAGQSY